MAQWCTNCWNKVYHLWCVLIILPDELSPFALRHHEWETSVWHAWEKLFSDFQRLNLGVSKGFGPFLDGVILCCIYYNSFGQVEWYIHFRCPHKCSLWRKTKRAIIIRVTWWWYKIWYQDESPYMNTCRLLPLLQDLLMQNFGTMPKFSVSLTTFWRLEDSPH